MLSRFYRCSRCKLISCAGNFWLGRETSSLSNFSLASPTSNAVNTYKRCTIEENFSIQEFIMSNFRIQIHLVALNETFIPKRCGHTTTISSPKHFSDLNCKYAIMRISRNCKDGKISEGIFIIVPSSQSHLWQWIKLWKQKLNLFCKKLCI